MATNPNSISVNPMDRRSIIALMDKHGDSKFPLFGENEDGESVIISICHDSVTVETFQSNGWLRKNIYNRDGTTEELFDGKWV